MKTKLILIASLLAVAAFGQTSLSQTTLSAAITVNQATFTVASTTNILAGTQLYVIDTGQMKGEFMTVRSIPVSGTITANRTSNKQPHVSGALVMFGPLPGTPNFGQAFQNYNPNGSCVAASTLFTPWVNIATGEQWLCSTVTLAWVPGWNNPAPHQPVADYAMATGASVPPGPLFQGTGTNATTSFTVASMIGYTGGEFCIIPTAAFTTTTAGNIAIATTAVAGKRLCYSYDSAATKPFAASY